MEIVNTTPRPGQKKVIILGGGFAGLEAAKTLAHHDDIHVRLIDQKNHHLFQPLLYQVATAGLNPSDIAIPIRSILSKAKNVAVHMGKITDISLKDRYVQGESGVKLGYDYLLVACGAQHSYFGKNEWEEFAPARGRHHHDGRAPRGEGGVGEESIEEIFAIHIFHIPIEEH